MKTYKTCQSVLTCKDQYPPDVSPVQSPYGKMKMMLYRFIEFYFVTETYDSLSIL